MHSSEINLEYEGTAFVKKLGEVGKHPIVCFERIKGSEHQIVCNLFADRQSFAIAMDCSIDNLNKTYLERISGTSDCT